MRRTHTLATLVLVGLSFSASTVAAATPDGRDDLKAEVTRLAAAVEQLTQALHENVKTGWVSLLDLQQRQIESRRAELSQLRASRALLAAELARALEARASAEGSGASHHGAMERVNVIHTEMARLDREAKGIEADLISLEADARSTRSQLTNWLNATAAAVAERR